jgi:hypothetical protein
MRFIEMRISIIILIIFFIISNLFLINGVQAVFPPPTVFIENPSNNQTVSGIVSIIILIHDYDYDGISDDLDFDVDNDTRLDFDKDGNEDDWDSSDYDHNNDGFIKAIDEDGDGWMRNEDPDDTNPGNPSCYSASPPSFPSNITVDLKIDNYYYAGSYSTIRDHWNGTWIITYEWDTTKYENGEHRIYTHSKLYDNYSNEHSVTVIVENIDNEKNKNTNYNLIIMTLLAFTIVIWSIIIYIKRKKKKSSQ